MKKLLLSLCSITIIASSMTVTSCSLVNNHKQSVKNKVKNLTNVSEVLLRSAIIEDVTTQKNSLGRDANELHNMIKASKANKLIPNFNTAPQTTIDSLGKSYFGDANEFSKTKIIENQKAPSLSLTNNNDKVRNSSTPADNYTPIINSVLTVLNASGGVTPEFAGLLEGFLPMLGGALPNDASSLSDQNMYGTAKEIYNNAELIGAIINILGNNTTLVQDIISTFLNINFFDALKTNDSESLMDQVLNFIKQSSYLIEKIVKLILNNPPIIGMIIDLIVNSVIKIGFENREEITNGMIINATVKRLNNILADLTNNTKLIDKNYDKNIDKNFNDNLSVIFVDLLSGNIDSSKISSHIIDIVYIISGIFFTISSINFEENKIPIDNDHIFINDLDNKEFIKSHRNQKINKNLFKTNILLNNLSLVFKPTENGYDLQKLLSLLFYSGGKQIEIEHKRKWTWLNTPIWITTNLIGNKNNYAGLAPIIQALGSSILEIVGIELPLDLGKQEIGNLLNAIIQNIALAQDMSGLPGLLEFVNSNASLPISISREYEQELKNSFNGFYKKDSHILSELTGIEGLSIHALLENTKIGDKLLSDILKELADALNGAVIDKKRFIYKNKSNQITTGLQQISFALSPKFAEEEIEGKPSIKVNKHNLIYGNNQTKPEYQNLTGLQTMIYASKYSGLKLQNNPEIKGAKAAMYGLGVSEDSKAFRENTLLNGLQLITTDKAFENILKQAIDGFSKVNNDRNQFISKNFIPYIQANNFKTKSISNSGIDENKDAYITYKIVFKDPFTKKSYEYKVELELKLDKKDWELKSINRM